MCEQVSSSSPSFRRPEQISSVRLKSSRKIAVLSSNALVCRLGYDPFPIRHQCTVSKQGVPSTMSLPTLRLRGNENVAVQAQYCAENCAEIQMCAQTRGELSLLLELEVVFLTQSAAVSRNSKDL